MSKHKGTLVDSVSVCYSYKDVTYALAFPRCTCRHDWTTSLHLSEVESIALSQQSFITPLQRRNNINRCCFAFDGWSILLQLAQEHNYNAYHGNAKAYYWCDRFKAWNSTQTEKYHTQNLRGSPYTFIRQTIWHGFTPYITTNTTPVSIVYALLLKEWQMNSSKQCKNY